MKMIKFPLSSLAIVIVLFFLVGYNAYHHNLQLLLLTIVTFMNSVGIGTLLKHLKK